jgi:hypothetical protein
VRLCSYLITDGNSRSNKGEHRNEQQEFLRVQRVKQALKEKKERRRRLEDQLSERIGFDLAMFVEVLVKASTKGREHDHPGLTKLERFMGVPSW